ncbi:MAG: hypothetical protein WA705_12155, partial [Candidatus Ozemobacteraceae bacterium]
MAIIPAVRLFEHFKVDSLWLDVLHEQTTWTTNPPKNPKETWQFLAVVTFFDYFPAKHKDSTTLAPGKRFHKELRKERWFARADKHWLRQNNLIEWDNHSSGNFSRRYRVQEPILTKLLELGIHKYDINLWTGKPASKKKRFAQQPPLNTITRKRIIKHDPLHHAIKILSSKKVQLNIHQLERLQKRVAYCIAAMRQKGIVPTRRWDRLALDCRKMLYIARQPGGYRPSYTVGESGRVTDVFIGLQTAHHLVKKAALWGVPHINVDLSDAHLACGEILTGKGLLPGIVVDRQWCIDFAYKNIKNGYTSEHSRKKIKKTIKQAFLATFNAGKINNPVITSLQQVFRWFTRPCKGTLKSSYGLSGFYHKLMSVVSLHLAVLQYAQQKSLQSRLGVSYTNACELCMTHDEIITKLTAKSLRIIKTYRKTKAGKKIEIPKNVVDKMLRIPGKFVRRSESYPSTIPKRIRPVVQKESVTFPITRRNSGR